MQTKEVKNRQTNSAQRLDLFAWCVRLSKPALSLFLNALKIIAHSFISLHYFVLSACAAVISSMEIRPIPFMYNIVHVCLGLQILYSHLTGNLSINIGHYYHRPRVLVVRELESFWNNDR